MVLYTMPIFYRLFFSCLCSFFVFEGVAKTTRRTTENSADLIEKARNLILQRDRSQAIHILVSAMRREPGNTENFKEMKSALGEIANVFLNDRAQQAYELALSLRLTDQKQSIARLQESLRTEPDNLQVINELARMQIITNNCENAFELVSQAQKNNPYDEQLLLTLAQIAVCQEDWPQYTSVRSQSDGIKGPYKKFWLALEVERADREKSAARLNDAYKALKQAEPNHPELAYWEWKIGKTNDVKKSSGNKYIQFCKNIGTSMIRKHLSNPYLCQRVSEVENNKNTEEIK